MPSLYCFVALGITLTQALAAAYTNPKDYAQMPVPRQSPLPSESVQQGLGPLLSKNASIFGPDDSRWPEATERYQDFAVPQVQVVVQPGVEDDIPTIVKYANEHDINFFVVNRGHSLTSTVGWFSGIQIDVRSLTDISINKDAMTVKLQAGARNYETIDVLWKEGYATTTGSCSCVGMVGPALGGGHGVQQGVHGLIADNLIGLNVVLANGTAITVSETSYPDLWWAMRGAGHNFGIVTSFDMKIYQVTVPSYYYRNYVFTGKHVEPLFEELNKFHANGSLSPTWGGAFGVYTMEPSVSTTEATIFWTFIYGGSKEDATAGLSPFDALGPVAVDEGNVPFTSISDILISGLESDLCAPSKVHITGTAGLQVYNVTVQRQLYDLYNKKVAKEPLLSGTKLVHEGYAVEGVLRGKPEDSAFPLRDDNLLMYFDAMPPPNSGLEDFAFQWARETEDLWNAGEGEWRKPTTYVNYAAGHESLESMYGYEPWRLEKLRALKAQYDPLNKFAYYNPIVPLES
ncbi:Putative dehydrogenase [Podospora comata]|uniref:Dehydrogenase n=1 Tax=Podospora comata TaxID=48703 RepID=A0ABY6SA69_PODCO|nr:Putative dehydrogenase [Podospora comata]